MTSPGARAIADTAGIVVGVGAIVVHDGRLLVVQRGRPPAEGLWSLPGGKVHRGESLATAVVRELEEETGLRGRVTGPCGLVEIIREDMHIIVHDFFVELGQAKPRPVAADDAADARFVTRDELEALPLTPGLLDFLARHGALAALG